MKPKSSWFMALSIAAVLAGASVSASNAQTLTIGVRGGPEFDRPALHRHRHACRGAEARIRHADLVRRRARDRAAPRRELEGDRCHDLGVQAAQGREVPRRLGLHRRRRQVLDRADPGRRRPQSDHDLRAPREGGEDRRPAHHPRHHRRPGADAAERLHPPVHRVVEGSGRPRPRRPPTRPSTRGKAAIGTGPYKFVSWTPKEQLVLDRFDGYWGGKEPWARSSARRSRTTPPASRS